MCRYVHALPCNVKCISYVRCSQKLERDGVRVAKLALYSIMGRAVGIRIMCPLFWVQRCQWPGDKGTLSKHSSNNENRREFSMQVRPSWRHLAKWVSFTAMKIQKVIRPETICKLTSIECRFVRLEDIQVMCLWGRWIVWCALTSWYLVSLLSVSLIHVSDIFLVGFWSWEISFIMWGCRGWGCQAAGTWVSVSVKWWDSPPHRVTWSQLINMHPVKARGRAEKPEGA